MSWNQESVVEQRHRFVIKVRHEGMPVAKACRQFNISRPTGYKWLDRYDEQGLEGLVDRSKAPETIPHKTSDDVENMICEVREQYGWGSAKILGYLQYNHPNGNWPSTTTIDRILNDRGLIESTPNRRRKVKPDEAPLKEADEPNRIWSVDFKGQFELKNGTMCYPLTIYDNYSRMLVGCYSLPSTGGKAVKRCMRKTFEEWGLPGRLRSDNGTPFASRAPGGLSYVSAWWHQLGITHERIDVGKPQQNGRQERFHLTLKQKCARPGESTLQQQQASFDQFRAFYNQVRPHQSLAQTPPSDHHKRSERSIETVSKGLSYPNCDLTRSVRSDGYITFANKDIYVSEALREHQVGLIETEVDVWMVRFADQDLGLFEPQDSSMSPVDKKQSVKRQTL